MRLSLLLLPAIALLAISPPARAQQQQDCSFQFQFTGDATQPAQNNSSQNTPCVNWRITWSTSGTLSTTVTFLTSPDGTTWTAVPNNICSSTQQPPCVISGANPSSGAQGQIYLSAYGKYVHVTTSSSTGSGTGTVAIFGVKGASASAGSGSGGGGSGPSVNAYYVVTQATSSPPNASNLGALSTGIPKLTVSAGSATVSTAVPGSDYAVATNGTSGQGLTSDGAGGFGSPLTFAPSATTDATNASNISSGTLASARLPTTIAANTTGQAATATALAASPTLCSTGQAPTGILPSGNATGCASIAGALPSGGAGQAQFYATSTTFAGQAFGLNSGGTHTSKQNAVECVYDAYNLSGLTTTNASQEITIIPSGLTGDFRFTGTTLYTLAGSLPTSANGAITASVGRTTIDTDLVPPVSIGSGAAVIWDDRPSAQIVGHANTYTAIVINFVSASTFGTTSGTLYWSVCGYFTGQ